jgi:hypothetical protein
MNGWYEAHGKPPVDFMALPAFGLIEEGLAAGFLYMTDSTLGLLEGFVTNPEAPMVERSKALERILHSLVEEAERLGVKTLVGLCAAESVVKLGLRNGFRHLGQYEMVAKEVAS